MFLRDIIFETYTAIVANKVRTGLTILGIVIGIASVIVMVAIGNGAQKDIEENIQSIGSNLLMIRPGSQGGPGSVVKQGQGSADSLTMEDVSEIEKNIAQVESIAPLSSGNFQVIGNGNNTNTSINGVTASYLEVRNIEVGQGVFISDINQTKLSKVAVIGPDVAEVLFSSEEVADIIGEKIRIDGIDFTIIGITHEKGGTGFGSDDDVVYIPLTTFQQYFRGDDFLSMINIKIEDQEAMESAEMAIEKLLFASHGITNSEDADFMIMNQSDIVETASSVTGTLTVLLGAVAGISLIVGGIGIMNMMLTTVTERTREIGLRKAIGAKRGEISKQFLLEAVALTFIGGVIGIVLGIIISWAVENFFSTTTQVSNFSILLAFGVSALIGIVFGYYPAKRASRLNPIEALRYE